MVALDEIRAFVARRHSDRDVSQLDADDLLKILQADADATRRDQDDDE